MEEPGIFFSLFNTWDAALLARELPSFMFKFRIVLSRGGSHLIVNGLWRNTAVVVIPCGGWQTAGFCCRGTLAVLHSRTWAKMELDKENLVAFLQSIAPVYYGGQLHNILTVSRDLVINFPVLMLSGLATIENTTKWR